MRAVLNLQTYEGTADQLSALVAEMERSGWKTNIETILGNMVIHFERRVK